MKIGLVLEGGGMRCIYTVGILDVLSKNNFLADYLIGVSAGASNGVSYISGQKGRGIRTNVNYINDKRYLSLSNFLKTGSLFGMDFIFRELPAKLDPFDYEAFFKCRCDYRVGVTNAETGEEEYFDKNSLRKEEKNTVLIASASMPIASPVVEYKGKKYYDGGTADPIPIKKAFEDGCDKVIVVLTRDRSFRKTQTRGKIFYKFLLRKYPKMVELLSKRHEIYNETLDFIRKMEKEGKAFVVAPKKPLEIERFERNKENLLKIYKQALKEGEEFWEKNKKSFDLENHKRI